MKRPKWRDAYTLLLTLLVSLLLWVVFLEWLYYMLRGMWQY